MTSEDVGVALSGARIIAAVDASVADCYIVGGAAAQRRSVVVGDGVEESLYQRAANCVDGVSK